MGTPGLRLVRLLGVKAEGERRVFLMYAIGEAYRVYGGSADLIERLCNTAISIGLSPTEVDAARQYIEEQETS